MNDEQKLCLYGELAKPFIKGRVGDKVNLQVTAVLTSAGMEPDYGAEPISTGKGKDKQPPKRPRVEFVIAAVNGKRGKAIDDMSNEEMESEISKVKEGGDTYEEPDDAA